MHILGIDGIDTFSSATKTNRKETSSNYDNDSNSNITEPIIVFGLDIEEHNKNASTDSNTTTENTSSGLEIDFEKLLKIIQNKESTSIVKDNSNGSILPLSNRDEISHSGM
jgi:hypothetical protein